MTEKKKKENEDYKNIQGLPQDYSEMETDEGLSPEEAQAKIAMLLARSKKIEMLTELKDDEIKMISILNLLGKKYNLPLLNDFIKEFLFFRVSKDRKGRKEIANIARPAPGGEENLKKSLKKMIMGG